MAAAVATTTDKKALMRDKRAQGIAAMGLVTRQGDRFQVQTPSLRGRRASYEVWRDDAGRVRCSCLEFDEGSATDQTFRCEHILAVKHSLVERNTEAATRHLPEPVTLDVSAVPKSPATTETLVAERPSPDGINESASEKSEASPLEETPAEDFGREQTSLMEAETPVAQVRPDSTHAPIRSLAQHTTEKEFAMKKQQSAIAEVELQDENLEEMNATAPVVSLGFTNVLRTLRQPVDPKLVKTREGWTDRSGNTHLVEYVEWHTVADRLDQVCPAWSHSVRNIVQIGDIVAVTAAITIGDVTREGVGTGTADNETGIKKAEHDALKRAAIKFGLARDLYQRESEVIERTGTAPDAGEFPRDPLAKSMADLVTPKQLGMIRALAREAGMDAEEECQAQLRCRTEELSKRAASSYIDHLKNAGGQAAANQGMRRAS